MIKHDNKSFVIFILFVLLLGTLLGWPVAGSFAAGWMIRNFMWVRHLNSQLPVLIKGAALKLVADGIAKSKNN